MWGYSLKQRPYIGLIYGRYLQFRFLKWPFTRYLEDLFQHLLLTFCQKVLRRHTKAVLGLDDQSCQRSLSCRSNPIQSQQMTK